MIGHALAFELDPPERPFAEPGPRVRTASLAGGAVLLWATWPTLAVAAGACPPFLLSGLAAAVGFALSFGVALVRGEALAFLRTPVRTLLVVTVGMTAHNVLFLRAVPRIGAAEANVLVYLWPILLVMLLSRVRRERIRRRQAVGILLSFIGAALAIGPSFALGIDRLGVVLAVLAGLAFAIMVAVRSTADEGHDVVGPAMGPIALLSFAGHVLFEPSTVPSSEQLLVAAAIGVAPLWLGHAAWDRAARGGHAAMISGIAYLTPIVAVGLLAMLGLGAFTTAALAGATLVVIGARIASGSPAP